MTRRITIVIISILAAGLLLHTIPRAVSKEPHVEVVNFDEIELEYEQVSNHVRESIKEPRSSDEASGVYRTVTAYTSRVQETDSTPCIGAWGDDLCEMFSGRSGEGQGFGICASNFYRKGTRLSINGYGTCTVLDRMNSRYTERVDIYMGYDLEAALEWGIKRVKVTEL